MLSRTQAPGLCKHTSITKSKEFDPALVIHESEDYKVGEEKNLIIIPTKKSKLKRYMSDI